MGTWTEANFLERLQAPLKSALEASENACPDAEMMEAYAAGSASEFVRNAVGEHLKMCADCRDLGERVAAFDASVTNAAALSAQEQAEWANAEKRLDIEAESYARRTEVNFKRAAELERGGERAAHVEEAPQSAAAWQFPWAKTIWSMAAVAALVALGLVLMRRESATPNSAAQAPVAAVAQPNGSSARPVVQPPIAVANDAGANATVPSATGGATVNELTPEGTAAGGEAARPAPKAHRTKPISSSAGNGTAVASKTAADAPTVAANAQDSAPNEVASSAAPSAPSRSSSTRSPIGARTASNRMAGTPGSTTDQTPMVAPTSTPSQPLPAAIHLNSGTRVWITLGTVTHESDANFAFTGTLFEPIGGPGNTPLDKATEVYGTGVMSGGKMSLYIKEFVIRGVHYRLTSASGAASAATAGGGAAVAFNAGQVQEMWLAAPADYEKVAAGGSKP